MAYISNPGSFEDIVELLVPELRKRGLMFDDYAVPGGTFRENLLRQPGQKTLREDHYGSQFTFEREEAQLSTRKRKADDVEPNGISHSKEKATQEPATKENPMRRYGTRKSVRVN
jgi:hypothetical protein